MERQGVYAIRCSDGRAYVGGSTHIRNRFHWHRGRLARGVHKNGKLQTAWLLFGAEAFTFEVLEAVPSASDLTAREQYWIDRLGAAATGFNLSPKAGGSNRGIVRTQAVRERVAASHIGTQAGEKNPSAKLTEGAVREIRQRAVAGDSHRHLAEQHGVSRGVVGRIIRREKWPHVL